VLVSVIIINYNTFSLTCDCIRSVQASTQGVPYEIIVVDNASPKDDPDEFLKVFPNIKLIKSGVNGGFAAGNNLGIENAAGDMILLLNSDTFLHEDSISRAADYLAVKDNIGALSVHLTYQDGRYQHNARAFRSIRNELLDLARPFLYLLSYKKRARLMLNQYFKGDINLECDWVSGAFFMFRKKALEKLPGQKLDERFFMYGEDQLWCYQFQEQGYKNFFLADTKLVHIANASTEPEKQRKLMKTMLANEFKIMEYRKGRSFYYYTFRLIFSLKEYARHYIKIVASTIFKLQIK
jgi:Predicted glycosyltransferases